MRLGVFSTQVCYPTVQTTSDRTQDSTPSSGNPIGGRIQNYLAGTTAPASGLSKSVVKGTTVILYIRKILLKMANLSGVIPQSVMVSLVWLSAPASHFAAGREGR
jgi:hypothetical protein